jgi:hypothetical protein
MSKNKALLIGINYMGTESALNGCINDVQNVFSYLKDRFELVNEVKWERSKSLDKSLDNSEKDDDKDGTSIVSIVQHLRKKFESGKLGQDNLQTNLNFQQAHNVDTKHSTVDVLIMTDDKSIRDPLYPKKDNIMRGIEWLVKDADENSHLFFHYSGHGTSVPDKNGDEMDGRDEALCPVDYNSAGFIVDDELNAKLVAPLPKGCVLRIITDCCHSGSITDLHYFYDNAQFLADKNKNDALKEDKKEKQVQADVVAWSGCMDNQTSADAYINGKFAGALTATFMEIMRDSKQQHTYANLYETLLNRLKQRKYTQRPILSCSKPVLLSDNFDLF